MARKKKKIVGYKPVVLFASKDRVPSQVAVPFHKHHEATFPKIFKTKQGAINYAKRNIKRDPDVWQLPGAKPVRA